jgi:hypothetical protein
MRVTLSMLLALLITLGTLASAAGLANAYDLRNAKGYPICDHSLQDAGSAPNGALPLGEP